MTQETGILLFAHGARDPAWARPFEAVASTLRPQMPPGRVALAFLEFMTPGMAEAGDALVAAGCTRVVVVPLFLGAGGHVRKDVPALMAELQSRHAGTTWTLAPSIGESALLVQAMADIALQSAAQP